MEGLDMSNIYNEVYVVNKKEKTLVGLGTFVSQSNYDFVVLMDGENRTFSNYSYTFECSGAVTSEVKSRFISKELKLLGFLYRTSKPLPESAVDDLLSLIDKVKSALIEDLPHCRSLLRCTSGYPKGETDDEIKQTLVKQVLGIK